jgi:hypothetical protein
MTALRPADVLPPAAFLFVTEVTQSIQASPPGTWG